MSKTWHKGQELNKEIEAFTVGNDFLTDEKLVKYDCIASAAHAEMLYSIGILKKQELSQLKKGLKEIIQLNKDNKFKISPEQEDCHTAIENYLTKKYSNAGRKIHTARSRNDQVLVAIQLYIKDELLNIKSLSLELVGELEKTAKKNEFVPMPGYTHMQKAMPSSIGLWVMSFAESMMDNLKLVDVVYDINDQCPLGSGAGYGTNIPVNRKKVAEALGFSKLKNNTLYVQNSRGKNETNVVFALSNIMTDLSKLATDLLLFSTKEFGFVSFPQEMCTGSSIMPQKKNLDVMELIRAKAASVNAKYIEITNITQKLPSGYNRDFQLIKKPLIEALDITKKSIKIMSLSLKKMKVNKENLVGACTHELYATDEANKLVMKGTPFREAYRNISENLDKLEKQDPLKNIKEKKVTGAPGNLGIKIFHKQSKQEQNKLKKQKKDFMKILDENLK